MDKNQSPWSWLRRRGSSMMLDPCVSKETVTYSRDCLHDLYGDVMKVQVSFWTISLKVG